MNGDYSRQRFDPARHYSAVLMQQGRVQLDADWNELVEILERRLRAHCLDTLGRAVVPRSAPDGFRIALHGDAPTIGRGRLYLDGLLVENHGGPGGAFDPALGELRGGDALPYDGQPHLPHALADAPIPAGPYLVYLDAWSREVSAAEDPTLIDPALGVDTTTRRQVAWQVRCLPLDPGALPDATTPDDDAQRLPGWAALTAPSGARLTNALVALQDDEDPDAPAAGAAYRSQENHLYRIEIHEGGDLDAGRATFKWSRDNACLSGQVLAVSEDRSTLTVDDLGRDEVLRFHPGDWIEVVHDRLAARGRPGALARVRAVDDDARALTLHAPLPADALPPAADLRRLHVAVRRWDQRGEVHDDQGRLLVDLDDPRSAGAIPVPREPGRKVILEGGIAVAFTVAEGPHLRLRVGDHWTFAARAADASIEPLDAAPPRGPHHHFARLALVQPESGTVTDLRRLWPEAADAGDERTIPVRAEDHNAGRLTLQEALDRLRDRGGTVLLGPGVYFVQDDALRIDGGRDLRIRGVGEGTILVRHRGFVAGEHRVPNDDWNRDADPASLGATSLLRVARARGLVVEDLVLVGGQRSVSDTPVVHLRSSAGVRLERCHIIGVGAPTSAAAIELHGALADLAIRDTLIAGERGVVAGPALLLDGATIEGCAFACRGNALELRGLCVHAGLTRFAGNTVRGGPGLILLGAVAGPPVEIEGNTLVGAGLVLGATAVRVRGNVIGGAPVGITVVPDHLGGDLDRVEIEGNDLRDLTVGGIRHLAHARHLRIAHNHLERVDHGAIMVLGPDDRPRSADEAIVEANTLIECVRAPRVGVDHGITVNRARLARIDRNTLVRVGALESGHAGVEALYVIDTWLCDQVEVTANCLREIGPASPQPGVVQIVAIHVVFTREAALVADNRLTSDAPRQVQPLAFWQEANYIDSADGAREVPYLGFGTTRVGGHHLDPRPPGRRIRATVRGNDLAGTAAVLISRGHDLVATGNRLFIDDPQAQPREYVTVVPDMLARLVFTGNEFGARAPALHRLTLDGAAVIATGNLIDGAGLFVVSSNVVSPRPGPTQIQTNPWSGPLDNLVVSPYGNY